jgi:hypothetical protein
MKSYRVTATFQDLPAAHAVQEAPGEGSRSGNRVGSLQPGPLRTGRESFPSSGSSLS